MVIRKTTNPGLPWRLRGPIPLAPAGDGGDAGGAAPKPDADQAAAAAAVKKAADDAHQAQIVAAAQAAVKKAEDDKVAAAAAEAAKKKAEDDKAALTPDERFRRFDEVEKKLDDRTRAIDEKATLLETKLERQREKSLVRTLRQMGADPEKITDEDLLTLAPKVDPDEPGAIAALAAWKASRSGLFKAAQVGPQEDLTGYKKALDENTNLSPRQKERRARMAERLLGGGDR